MTKNEVLQSFLNLKEKGNIKGNFNTYEELLDVLSEKFEDKYYNMNDAQDAYNDLNDDLGGLLNECFGEYTLGTKEWEICCETNDLESVLKQWNDYYSCDVKDADDLCSEITNRVMDDMANVGCDVHNALNMICNDVFGGDCPVYVDMGDENPRISFWVDEDDWISL